MIALWVLSTFLLPYVSGDPNFVFILTDDQDALLDGMVPLTKTAELITAKGKTFSNAFATIPVCCPSRSSLLTGKYGHNTGVTNNSIEGNCSSSNWQQYQEPYSISALLKEAKNYVTFYAGKYLNQYGEEKAGGLEYVPKGYDWWLGLRGNSRYYNYSMSVNGSAVEHEDGEEDYFTDVVANYGIEFLKNRPTDRPFFMTVATPAAHAPFTPAVRHQDRFTGLKALRTPSFNHTPTDKHWLVTMIPDALPENVTILDEVHQHRHETLLAVDEMVERIVALLEEQGVLNDTYLIYTSDHGFHIGQFTQPWDKRQPYETDLRVPFAIRGPNVKENSIENYPVLLVDIAPTVLDLAGVKVPTYMDGQSLKGRILNDTAEEFTRFMLIEYWGEHDIDDIDEDCPWTYDDNLTECVTDQWCKCQDSKNNTYTCIIEITDSRQFKYCQFDDDLNFVEAYSVTDDPYELTNIAGQLDETTVKTIKELMARMKSCHGETCRKLNYNYVLPRYNEKKVVML